jgi:uncharacterized protein
MAWTIDEIQGVLAAHEGWLVCKEDACICVTNEDGLDAFVAVSGQQILVESILFAKSQVKDTAKLNDAILKMHKVFPLSTMAISVIGNEEYYTAFGALSAQSDEGSIRIEVATLFDNVAGFLDAYEDYLSARH